MKPKQFDRTNEATTASPVPRLPSIDSSVDLFRSGYAFISHACRQIGSDIFETRLLLRKTVCMTGEDAARLFYDEALFTRERAAPRRVHKTLFGKAGVQSLDGEAHRQRKRMLM